MQDFIEFPNLHASPLDWRSSNNRLASDCKIVSCNCTTRLQVSYSVHTQVLAISSRYFLKLLAFNANPNLIHTDSIEKIKDSTTNGDIMVKLQDGSCFRVGSISQSLLNLKKQLQGLLNIPVHEQRLFTTRGQGEEIEENWRSLAGCGLTQDDTLLIVPRESWQEYDPGSRTLTFRFPTPCDK